MSTITRRTLLSSGVAAGIAVGSCVAGGATAAIELGGGSSRLVVDGLDVSQLNGKFLDLVRQGGVDCVHKTVGGVVGGGSPDDNSFGAVYAFADEHSDRMAVTTSVREIRQARKSGRTAFILGWQDANILDGPLRSAGVFTAMVGALRAYSELGLRIIGICYNSSNIFGGGCLEHREPLTQAGRRLVEEIHKRRLLLDVGGHTGEQTSLDAIEISQGIPVVSTHTNMAAINPNMRCISDRLAVALARTGGVIGVNALGDFHNRNPKSAVIQGDQSPQVTLDKHLDQYDYLKKLVGVEHIGLGPDFTWGTGFESVGEAPADVSLNWPYGESGRGRLLFAKDYENISQLPSVVNGLKDRGWSEADLDKLLGGNWLRVYERVWGA